MSIEWKSPNDPPKRPRVNAGYSNRVLVWAYDRDEGTCEVREAMYAFNGNGDGRWVGSGGFGMAHCEVLSWTEMPDPPSLKDKKVSALANAFVKLGMAFWEKFGHVVDDRLSPEMSFDQRSEVVEAARVVKSLLADEATMEALKSK